MHKEAWQGVCVRIRRTTLCISVYVLISASHGCPALHRRAGPLAPRDNHSLAEGYLFFSDLGWWRGPGARCFSRVRGMAQDGNILALLLAVCGSPLAYYSFACGGIPFVPYASRWVWVGHACLLCLCTCVLFFLVVVSVSPRESRPSCLASFVFLQTILLARGGGGLVARAAVCTGGHTFRSLSPPT